MNPEQRTKHNELFTQFIKEMFIGQPEKAKSNKPKSTLQSTRTKFLQRMKDQEKSDPGKI